MKDGDPTHRLDVRVERWTQDELNEPSLEHPKMSRTEHYRGTMDDCDLAALAADPDRLREFRRPILETWNMLEEMAKPTICQVHGACIGGAMELALACDLRTMAADAVIGMPETRVGLVPDVGGSSARPSARDTPPRRMARRQSSRTSASHCRARCSRARTACWVDPSSAAGRSLRACS